MYDDTADTFLLSGAEDLVPIVEDTDVSGRVTRYRPRTEGLFARLKHYAESDYDFWNVWSKDGLKSTYGTDPAEFSEDEQAN